MKQVSKVEEKPFTSSLTTVSVQKPVVERGGGGGSVTVMPPPPSLHHSIPYLIDGYFI